MTGHSADIVIISNSPGELSSWVRITASRLKEKNPGIRIIVMLVPCPYASGRELKVAEGFSCVDIVLSPDHFLKFMFFGSLPESYKPSKRGIVAFLGGDYWHAAWLSWKLKYPAVAYTSRPYAGFEKHFRYIFCPYVEVKRKLEKKGFSPEKIIVSGNLMVEGVKPSLSKEESLRRLNLSPDRLTVGIFPGSRLYHMQDSLPIFLKVAEEINGEIPDIQFVLGLSPFLSTDELKDCLKNPRSPIPGVGGSIVSSDGKDRIVTAGGVSVHIPGTDQYDTMNMSDVVLTIPGTNTAEVAYLGKPMVVAASWKARIPRGGLGFFINYLPLGPLRRSLIMKILEKQKFTSLPNMISGRPIVPEVMIENKAEEITREVLKVISDEEGRMAMSREIKEVMGPSGAVDTITDTILKILNLQEAQ